MWVHYDYLFLLRKECQETIRAIGAGVYIKCEIHIPPHFSIHSFFPKGNLFLWGGARSMQKILSLFL